MSSRVSVFVEYKSVIPVIEPTLTVGAASVAKVKSEDVVEKVLCVPP